MTPPADETTSPNIAWRYCLGLLVLAAALHAYAIWSPHYLPLVDLPNHLARHYLEYLKLSGGALPPFYDIHYRVLPNLGADLALPPLLVLLSPEAACKAFVTLSALLYWLGPAVFIVQHGGGRREAVVAALLLLPWVLSSQLFWGFINFYSGLGLAFLVLAHYVRLSRRERLSAVGLLVHAGLVALLFLWHLAPWGIYGVLLGCHLLADGWRRWRDEGRLGAALGRALLFGLATAPSLLLFAYYSSQKSGVDPSARFVWGGWVRKATAPLTLFRGYDTLADLGALVLWVAAVAAAFGWWAVRGRQGSWLLLGLAALVLLYVLIPFQLGTTSDTDSRLLPAMLVCCLALLSRLPLKYPRLALLLLAAGLLLRCGSVTLAWQRLSDRLEVSAAAIEQLEPGSRVLPLVLLPEPSKEYPEQHFLGWAVIRRGVYLPTLFALSDQHTLILLPPRRDCVCRQADAYEVEEGCTRESFDYVWVYNPQPRTVRVPDGFTQVFVDGPITVWRVR